MVSKTWCFTLNNYSPLEEQQISEMPGVSYLIYGREVATTGTRHLQGYVTFATAKRLTGVRKLNSRAHWEIARSVEASIRYCKKDGDFVEVDNRKPRLRAPTVRTHFPSIDLRLPSLNLTPLL